ncbi:MAG: hypothetical protein GF311_10405 [Candidatus Lokiarchaeota archaeon]|nr:hypothetical protein [Candidatus Lokiarchaeota archaeon]
MIEVGRYNPRTDEEGLKALFEDFIQNKSYFQVSWEQFKKELDKRVLDLTERNGMITAKEDGKLVGWGTYSQFTDYLGNIRVLIHQVMTFKQDSYKRGIEEQIIRELEKYIKNTLKIDKAYYLCTDTDSSLRSLFLKLGIKKSDYIWYEKML